MDMSDRIKERRKAMGYTQEELGEKLGLQKSAIAKYENGRVENIKRSIIAEMAKVLECSPCYLLGWEEPAKKVTSIAEKFPTRYKEIIDVLENMNDTGLSAVTAYAKSLCTMEEYKKKEA